MGGTVVLFSQSCGNGDMMRMAPVGYLFNTFEENEEQCRLVTMPPHNSKEAIDCATLVAKIILLARKGYSKEDIIHKLNIVLCEKEIKQFNYTCSSTIDVCLYALFTTDSFDSANLKVLSYGGDVDTNAYIVGGMVEAMYGIDEQYIKKVNKIIPEEFKKVLKRVYKCLK